MTDRELLELAAKAAGIDGWWENAYLSFIKRTGGPWNPLTDDGDALRLAVARRIVHGWGTDNSVWARGEFDSPSRVFIESNERNGVQDEYAALRRAITRCAAYMVQSLPATSSASSS